MMQLYKFGLLKCTESWRGINLFIACKPAASLASLFDAIGLVPKITRKNNNKFYINNNQYYTLKSTYIYWKASSTKLSFLELVTALEAFNLYGPEYASRIFWIFSKVLKWRSELHIIYQNRFHHFTGLGLPSARFEPRVSFGEAYCSNRHLDKFILSCLQPVWWNCTKRWVEEQ